MVNSMREEIMNLLIYDENELSKRFNMPLFEAQMLSYAYKNLNSQHYRTMMVDKIASGFYSTEKEIRDMAYQYISKSALNNPEKGKKLLIEKCGLDEEGAVKYIEEMKRLNSNLGDMLSAELDVSNTNIVMREMTDGLIDTLLNSEVNKPLER